MLRSELIKRLDRIKILVDSSKTPLPDYVGEELGHILDAVEEELDESIWDECSED